MAGTEDSRSRLVQTLAPYTWRGSRILEAVCQVNEHLVSALSELARRESASLAIVRQNADVLRRFDTAACKRAASIPVLLLDLRFQDADWWRHAVSASTGPQTAARQGLNLSARQAEELARETLIVAWLSVQHTRECAGLLFGMSAQVAGMLAELTPRQLSNVAERFNHELKIRWQGSSAFWRKLLIAGQCGNASDLSEAHLLGLRLLGGELLATR